MTKSDKLLAILAYLLAWITSIALTIADWMVARYVIRALVSRILANIPTEVRVEQRIFPEHVLSAVDRITILVLGVMAFGFVFFFEYIYRRAAGEGELRNRFLGISALQAGLFIVCILVTLAIELL